MADKEVGALPLPQEASPDPIGTFFAKLTDSLDVQVRERSVKFRWVRKGIGFGELTFYIGKDGELAVDDEHMSGEFCLDILREALRASVSQGPAPARKEP